MTDDERMVLAAAALAISTMQPVCVVYPGGLELVMHPHQKEPQINGQRPLLVVVDEIITVEEDPT